MNKPGFFDFVDDPALKKHLINAHELILELIFLTENTSYQEKETLLISIRKTIIIQIAALVEALLLWRLKKIEKNGEVVIDDEWEYTNPHKIYEFVANEEIVWAHRKQVKRKIDQLDFSRITQKCAKYKILKSKRLIEDITKIRKLRNNLHIGSLGELEEKYNRKDLEFCFSILERVVTRISAKLIFFDHTPSPPPISPP